MNWILRCPPSHCSLNGKLIFMWFACDTRMVCMTFVIHQFKWWKFKTRFIVILNHFVWRFKFQIVDSPQVNDMCFKSWSCDRFLCTWFVWTRKNEGVYLLKLDLTTFSYDSCSPISIQWWQSIFIFNLLGMLLSGRIFSWLEQILFKRPNLFNLMCIFSA